MHSCVECVRVCHVCGTYSMCVHGCAVCVHMGWYGCAACVCMDVVYVCECGMCVHGLVCVHGCGVCVGRGTQGSSVNTRSGGGRRRKA